MKLSLFRVLICDIDRQYILKTANEYNTLPYSLDSRIQTIANRATVMSRALHVFKEYRVRVYKKEVTQLYSFELGI
jgi:hypothetical protein